MAAHPHTAFTDTTDPAQHSMVILITKNSTSMLLLGSEIHSEGFLEFLAPVMLQAHEIAGIENVHQINKRRLQGFHLLTITLPNRFALFVIIATILNQVRMVAVLLFRTVLLHYFC